MKSTSIFGMILFAIGGGSFIGNSLPSTNLIHFEFLALIVVGLGIFGYGLSKEEKEKNN
jgi:hypothetical protein